MWMEFLFVYYFLCFRSVFHFIFRPTNIYNEPAVYEVQRALPVITELRTRIEELLLEWPDHPGLKQVLSDVYCPMITHSNASPCCLNVLQLVMKFYNQVVLILASAATYDHNLCPM